MSYHCMVLQNRITFILGILGMVNVSNLNMHFYGMCMLDDGLVSFRIKSNFLFLYLIM